MCFLLKNKSAQTAADGFESISFKRIKLNSLAEVLIDLRHNRKAVEMFLSKDVHANAHGPNKQSILAHQSEQFYDLNVMKSTKLLSELIFTQLVELISMYDNDNYTQNLISKGFFPTSDGFNKQKQFTQNLMVPINRKGEFFSEYFLIEQFICLC